MIDLAIAFCHPHNYLVFANGRSRYQPPDDLLKLLWPEVEEKLMEVIELRKKLSVTDPRRPSDGIYEFLKVMMMLRVVFLQDAPFLMDIYPGHPTWNHGLFTNDAFIKWKHHIIQKVDEPHRSGVTQGGAVVQVKMHDEFLCVLPKDHFSSPEYSY